MKHAEIGGGGGADIDRPEAAATSEASMTAIYRTWAHRRGRQRHRTLLRAFVPDGRAVSGPTVVLGSIRDYHDQTAAGTTASLIPTRRDNPLTCATDTGINRLGILGATEFQLHRAPVSYGQTRRGADQRRRVINNGWTSVIRSERSSIIDLPLAE